MPSYRYRCDAGHEYLHWRSIHAETIRERPCDECSRMSVMVLASPAIAADALPNKKHGVRAINEREKRWDKDMPAYYRLRKEGLHPKGIDGAHLVEQEARDPLEVSAGRPLGADLGKAKEAASALMQNDPRKKGAEIGKALREGRELPV